MPLGQAAGMLNDPCEPAMSLTNLVMVDKFKVGNGRQVTVLVMIARIRSRKIHDCVICVYIMHTGKRTKVKLLSTASMTISIGVVWLATHTLPHFALFSLQK